MAGWKEQQACRGGDENPDVCRPVPPFWWRGPQTGQSFGTEPNEYETGGQHQNVEKVDVLNEMKLDDPGEYVPGEIFKNQKSPVNHKPEECTLIQWTPKNPDFYKPFNPESVPRSNNYLYSQVKRRQMMDLASTLQEDSDYSVEGGDAMCISCRVDLPEQPPVYGAAPTPPSHPVNEFGYNPATLTPCQRIIEATNAHIAGTNPFCFRDVIGRN